MQGVKGLIKKQFVMLSMVVFMLTGTVIPEYVEPVQAETTVYVTRTGSKYHTHKCGNGTYYASSRSSAKARGLTPCKKCFPNGDSESTSSSGNSSDSIKPAMKEMKLNKSECEMIKGQTVTLKVSNAPGEVTWSSTDSSVVAVSSSGKLTAKAKGKATITVISENQSKKCKVTVEEPQLNHTMLTMDLKESANLKLSGCKHSVKWYSNDNDIVKVSNGKLTAKDVGKTVIKAKVHGTTFSCKVTVRKPDIESLTVRDYETIMECGDWQDVEIYVSPNYALDYYDDFEVTSSDPSVISAELMMDWDGVFVNLESGWVSGAAEIKVSAGGQSTSFIVNVVDDERYGY